MQFEIYWDDLTREAKHRLKEMYHENIDMTPIAVIELEEDYAPDPDYAESEDDNIN